MRYVRHSSYVTFFDAMRFVNRLHNGQPTGAQDASTTETGVYSISDGTSETRAVDAQFFIPTENEWYKAAYYHPSAQGGPGGEYWSYATASDAVPIMASANVTGDISNPGTNVANYFKGADWNLQNGNVTTVGSAGALSESSYGTSDQSGNVWEWNETLQDAFRRVFRGGSWFNPASSMPSSLQNGDAPASQTIGVVGLRVASPVPAVCGDGMIGGGEECDDGDLSDGDGCSSTCTVERRSKCTGDPSVCITGIPAVSAWGLTVIALLLLAGAKVCFDRRRFAQT